jgi:hypothetical protein
MYTKTLTAGSLQYDATPLAADITSRYTTLSNHKKKTRFVRYWRDSGSQIAARRTTIFNHFQLEATNAKR